MKNNRAKIIVAVLFIAAVIYFEYDTGNKTENNRKLNLSYSFDNVVQDVVYDVKGIPEITVAGRKYYLSAGYNFDHQIEKGDSIIKRQGKSVYTLVKGQSRKILYFNN